MSRNARVDPVVAAMEKMEKQRQARRNKASKFRRDRKAEEKRNEREGRPGDVDFQRLIKKWRKEHLKDEKEVCASAFCGPPRAGAVESESARTTSHAATHSTHREPRVLVTVWGSAVVCQRVACC